MHQQNLALLIDADTDAGRGALVRLRGQTDVIGFKREARQLLAWQVAPEHVVWQVEDSSQEERPAEASTEAGSAEAAVRVPAAFVSLCDDALLHRTPQRFAQMYRLLWRLVHEPGLRHDPLDADLMAAQQLARAVRRDKHKMHAFVRFTAVGGGRHVAWFEPAHHIVEANADFFVRRFTQMHWTILTPDRCVAWDGQRLSFAPGAQRHEAPPPDAGEALWLTYYQHIFNPARLKLKMMAQEMPRRYWHNLPEAALIAPLAAAAQARSEAMVEATATPARRFRPITIPVQAVAALSDLPALRAAANACDACPIGALATQAVCGEGPLSPTHMLVGEQPGDAEDIAGRPFVGPAGQLLDRALAQLGWPRESVYLANAVKHFKFELRGKRRLHKTAAQREVEACLHWLEQEVALVQPQRLVALGATAARALLGRPVAVEAERGVWLHERPDGRPVMVTWHPAAVLRMDIRQREEGYQRWLGDLAVAREDIAPAG